MLDKDTSFYELDMQVKAFRAHELPRLPIFLAPHEVQNTPSSPMLGLSHADDHFSDALTTLQVAHSIW